MPATDPRKIKAPLDTLKIRHAKPLEAPYKLRDGKGLYIEIRPTGKKLWRYRFRVPGDPKEKMFTIGEYGDRADQVNIAAAREARDEARKLIKRGINPTEHRRDSVTATVEEAKNTFRAVALEWVEDNKPDWSPYYLSQIERGLRDDIYPAIGDKPIRAVTSADLLAIVKAASKRGAPTVALNLRQWLSAVFRYAVAHQRADIDPSYAIRKAVKRGKVKHHSPLALKEIPALLDALGTYGGQPQTIIAMRLLMLTFVRPGELRAAKWTEFDLEGALWTVPPERMKMAETHLVPLSGQAVALLRELHKITGKSERLFPNNRSPNACMTATTLNRALENMGYGGRFSSHGFRATFSTWANEVGHRSDLIERQLSHGERNKSRASYNSAKYLPERTAMMQQWATMIDAEVIAAKDAGAKVIPLKASKAK